MIKEGDIVKLKSAGEILDLYKVAKIDENGIMFDDCSLDLTEEKIILMKNLQRVDISGNEYGEFYIGDNGFNDEWIEYLIPFRIAKDLLIKKGEYNED